jgi:hypothetical protein
MLIRLHLGPLARRVPVNDDSAKIHGAVKKLIPNPQQVFDALASKRNARPPTMIDVFSDAKKRK